MTVRFAIKLRSYISTYWHYEVQISFKQIEMKVRADYAPIFMCSEVNTKAIFDPKRSNTEKLMLQYSLKLCRRSYGDRKLH